MKMHTMAGTFACCAGDAQPQQRVVRNDITGSGQRLEGFGTQQYGSVGRFNEVDLILFHPAVEGAGSVACNGGCGFDGEHHGLRAAFLAVQEDALLLRPQKGGLLPFHQNLNMPRELQRLHRFLAAGSGGC